jgi:hypothetical protein
MSCFDQLFAKTDFLQKILASKFQEVVIVATIEPAAKSTAQNGWLGLKVWFGLALHGAGVQPALFYKGSLIARQLVKIYK